MGKMPETKAADTQLASSPLNPRHCWRAVAARDTSSDGKFVYTVRSTGIYCRPSCPSRRPQRAQVQFFAVPETAERNGFRPCRRCRPRNAARSPQAELVGRLCRHIEAHLDGALPLESLAAQAGLSPHHLQRTFRRVMGISPRQYADALRLRRLKKQLRKGDDVTTALYEAGYGSSSRLYERSDAQLGMTPATYRHGGRGMRIRYTISKCSLGRLLVAANRRRGSAVYLGGSDWPPQSAAPPRDPGTGNYRDTQCMSHLGRGLLR